MLGHLSATSERLLTDVVRARSTALLAAAFLAGTDDNVPSDSVPWLQQLKDRSSEPGTNGKKAFELAAAHVTPAQFSIFLPTLLSMACASDAEGARVGEEEAHRG